MAKKDKKYEMPGEKKEEPAQEHGMASGEMETISSSGTDMPSAGMEGDSSERESSDDQMPGGEMGERDEGIEMPLAGMEGGSQRVLIELRLPAARGAASDMDVAAQLGIPGFQLDPTYEPVPVDPPSGQARSASDAGAADTEGGTIIVRGTVDESKIPEIEAQDNVVKVWKDGKIAPFGYTLDEEEEETAGFVFPMEGFAACPIGTCDCSPGTPKGSMTDVANYLGVNQIWSAGRKGEGIVVGVVDGGITAQGRTIKTADTSSPSWPNKLIPRVIGGFPAADWGTTGVAWGWHGNMCSTDVLGMAPNAQVYDIRISDGPFLSTALQAFQWAINRHRADGTPQILTNSWGIFQENWDPDYARNPNHPFTRKVLEALDEGILVLFAAGNCGGTCPDDRCGPDNGPGKSIWGANGHPRVMTVGAVNKNEQFVGYSSQGPGALDPNKPDFCSVTHFQGFFNSDSGTSAATPIAAGVVALLKQSNPSLSQDQAKNALKSTAKDIGPAGWDQHSGAGIIRAKAAYDSITAAAAGTIRTPSEPVVAWGPNRLDVFVAGTDSALYHKWWNGSAWGPSLTGYEFQGGKIISDPKAVSWGPNRLDVFVLGTDRGLYHKWWNGSAWGPSLTGYEFQGGVVVGNPEVATWGPNRLDVFVVGTDSALYHKWWNGSAWGPSLTGYEFQGGKVISDPEVVAWGPNRLDVFVVGTDRGLYHKWWNGSAWGPSLTGYEFQGGVILDQPKAVSWGPNRLDVFVLGTDRALYHKWWNGSAWGPSLTGYEFLGGKIITDPEAVAWGPNRLDVFVVGTDSALYHKWWNGSSWGPSLTGYEFLGGKIVGKPRVVSWGPNRLDVFVVGTDRALYHKWWNGSSWGPSLTGYERLGGVITRF